MRFAFHFIECDKTNRNAISISRWFQRKNTEWEKWIVETFWNIHLMWNIRNQKNEPFLCWQCESKWNFQLRWNANEHQVHINRVSFIRKIEYTFFDFASQYTLFFTLICYYFSIIILKPDSKILIYRHFVKKFTTTDRYVLYWLLVDGQQTEIL